MDMLLPASVEQKVALYAIENQLTPNEALVTLVLSGLDRAGIEGSETITLSPEIIAECEAQFQAIEAGGPTFSRQEVEESLEAIRQRRREQQAG